MWSAGWHSISARNKKHTPCSPVFKEASTQPAVEKHSRCDSVGSKMQLSSVVASPGRLLQLCISTLCCILTSAFSKVRGWTAGSCKGPASPVPPADSGLDAGEAQTPTSVNYHFTRKCNYKCGFCFHTAKTSFVLPLEEAKKGLRLLKESGTSDRWVCSGVLQWWKKCWVRSFTAVGWKHQYHTEEIPQWRRTQK